jgi:hypothetical protein
MDGAAGAPMDGFTASSRISPGGRVPGTFRLEIKVPTHGKRRGKLTRTGFTYWPDGCATATIRYQSNRRRSPP